jgi:2-dehydro-3-deoxyphosphogluconate aldolase / (4S)-4-hydroxy-2-oxoglutarate aldolase
MTKDEVRARIEEVGILPAARVPSAEDARFAVEVLARGGIPITEIPMTVPGALELIAELRQNFPDIVVGAGTVLEPEIARACIDAGALFLTSTGLDLKVVEVAAKENILVLPGALTPTEVIAAWKAGADFVKVFPCALLGGDVYIRALRAALPHAALIAAGGVRQPTAGSYIAAGAAAIGVGKELLPQGAIQLRNTDWILELAHRFLSIVHNARDRPGLKKESVVTFR